MQTSFMHPPFGFALFYLRSVAPKAEYVDKVTGKKMEPITTGQIYWGAVPFVVIQCIMVALVIAFPQMVMHYKKSGVQLNQEQINQQFDKIGLPDMSARRPARPRPQPTAEDRVTAAASGCEKPGGDAGLFCRRHGAVRLSLTSPSGEEGGFGSCVHSQRPSLARSLG